MEYLLLFNTAIILVAFPALFVLLKRLRGELAEWEPVETAEVDQGKLFQLVEGISEQFTTDSGLSIKDAVNRLEDAAKQHGVAAEILKSGVREDRVKAELDREQLQRLLMELYQLTLKVGKTNATAERIEKAATDVADDLAAAHKRADDIGSGNHGAAADAAARQTDKEKEQAEEVGEGEF